MEGIYLSTALFLLISACILALFIWFAIRFVGLMDDVRFLSDVAKKNNPDTPYRQTSSIVIIGIVAIPLALFFSSAAIIIASLASLPGLFDSLYLMPIM